MRHPAMGLFAIPAIRFGIGVLWDVTQANRKRAALGLLLTAGSAGVWLGVFACMG